MSAYSALAGIPIIGPALGVAAAAVAIAFGGKMAQGVMGGGSSSPSSPSVSTPSVTQPTFTENRISSRTQQESSITTYVRIPEDSILTGRKLLDFIDEALGDGKTLTNLRFIPA